MEQARNPVHTYDLISTVDEDSRIGVTGKAC